METPKLTQTQKANLRLFVAALRSGKYRQTKGNLAEFDLRAKKKKLCCLGVACEVAKANGLNVEVRRDESNLYYYNGILTSLPPEVRDFYGFVDVNPALNVIGTELESCGRGSLRAAVLNDDYNQSFRQLADLFEKTYLIEAANEETHG